ncbi:MAG: 16S rRNA (uracil(1498)-N(3))-methyltransferase [Fibrobacteres bacterium]|nr:16S rRNA (uracil(1498)-N(3))-methyltransferase [Fibrobacterota bacterium]
MAEAFSESWFYAPDLNAPGDRFRLPEDESHHLRKVLRLRMGTPVIAGNGRGLAFTCATSEAGSGVELKAVTALAPQQEQPRVRMVLSLLKGRDLEEPVDALCQLEIARISIVITDRSQEFKGQDHSRLVERLRAKAIVGLKQSKKPWLTTIEEPQSLESWRQKHPDLKVVTLHPGEDRLPPVGSEIALLCGPEGGLSDRELAWLESQGGYRMGLGPTRVRAVHAPILAFGKLLGLNPSVAAR